MKNGLWKILMCVLVFLTSASAQLNGIRFEVPFQFQVDKYQLPAGNYRVSAVNDRTLLISRIDGSEAAVAMTEAPIESPLASGRARLVFMRYADKHFLSETWLNSGFGHKLPKSAEETEYARTTPQKKVVVYTATM